MAVPWNKTAPFSLPGYEMMVAKLKDYRHLEEKGHSASKYVPYVYATLYYVLTTAVHMTLS
jgi:hypothetical protein